MAHYAYLDENNIVVDVIVGKDETELINGLDPEIYYAQGTDCIVKRTSYSGSIRYNFAGLGYFYDSIRDAFIPPKCHDEAIVNESTCQWDCINAEHQKESLDD